MIELLNEISTLLASSNWLAPMVALIGGALTAFTPCSLSSIPLVIICTGSNEASTKKSFLLSVVFAIGMTITFVALGLIFVLLGNTILLTGQWWYIILGVLLLLMSLQMLGIFTFVKPTYLNSKNNKKGYIGAFLGGVLSGLFSSPCATPVLVTLFALVSVSSNILWSIVLLLFYSIGYSILVIIAGTSIGFTRKIIHTEKYGMVSKIIQIVISIAIFVLALYMFYLGF